MTTLTDTMMHYRQYINSLVLFEVLAPVTKPLVCLLDYDKIYCYNAVLSKIF